MLTSLKSLLKDAQRRGHVAQNVAVSVSIKRDNRDKARLKVGVDIPTPDEIKRIIHAATGRMRRLLIVAIFTGLRSSELRGLRWDDVDLEAKELHVRQRADRYNEMGKPKSKAGERVIPLGPMVVNTLREWRLACPRGELGLALPNCLIHRNKLKLPGSRPGFLMLRYVPRILGTVSERFPISPKTSVRHDCDTRGRHSAAKNSGVSRTIAACSRNLQCAIRCDMERVTAQQASDLALVTSEGERLGVFGRHGIDSQPFAAVEREARVELLGVGELRDRRVTPLHRPPGIDSPLLRDRIVQTVLFERAANQKADEGNRD